MIESDNYHRGTLTRWIAALSAAACNDRGADDSARLRFVENTGIRRKYRIARTENFGRSTDRQSISERHEEMNISEMVERRRLLMRQALELLEAELDTEIRRVFEVIRKSYLRRVDQRPEFWKIIELVNHLIHVVNGDRIYGG
jgi:hypothetical protein